MDIHEYQAKQLLSKFGVNIIHHTKEVTTWGFSKIGDYLNLEIDTLARYVARLNEVNTAPNYLAI